MDALDAFMMSIKSGGMDSKTRMELKRRGVELRQQRTQLERLVALTKPCSLPPLAAKLVTHSYSIMNRLPMVLFCQFNAGNMLQNSRPCYLYCWYTAYCLMLSSHYIVLQHQHSNLSFQ